jgi:hypothetical protein
MGKFCGRSIKSASHFGGSINKCGRAANSARLFLSKMRPSQTKEQLMQNHPPAVINEDVLNGLLGRAITDFGATSLAALVVIGDRLGLYRVLATSGALTASELAEKSGTHERYVREWLNAHAASGYVNYLADSGRYQLSPEQAMLFAQEESWFQIRLTVIRRPRRRLVCPLTQTCPANRSSRALRQVEINAGSIFAEQ